MLQRSSEHRYRRVPVISAFGAPGTREYSVVSAPGALGSREYSVVSALSTREHSVISAFGAPGILASTQLFQGLVQGTE